jgi:hypothetical protein
MRFGTWLTGAGLLVTLGACSGTTVFGTGNAGAGGEGEPGGRSGSGAIPDGDAGEPATQGGNAGDLPGWGGGTAGGTSGGTSGGAGSAGASGFGGFTQPPLDEVDGQKQSDKLDVLFVVDNSVSMAGKQSVLAKSVQAFVQRLVNPWCVDSKGNPVATQPASGNDECTSGVREFTPVTDMHLGAITTSLGSHGGQVCSTPQSADDHLDDKGQLLPTMRTGVTTYENSGFLALDSTGQSGSADPAAVTSQLSDMILAAGDHGCGYEAPLESMYRFLVDPAPPVSVALVEQTSTPVGLNQALLDQRAAFLRPDSSVAIVVLSDENDCSIRDDGVGWFVGSSSRMPRATVECEMDPGNPCCRSCALNEAEPPSGCVALSEDANCKVVPAGQAFATWDAAHDSLNTRCVNQRGRFGFDLLYEVERYTNALTNYKIYDRNANLVDNPLFAARDGKPRRSNSLISVSLIVGAPWQDLASSDSLTSDELNYLSASQLVSAKRWPMLIGDTQYGAPSDPLMREAIDPRSGMSPLTGAPLVPANSNDPLANPANGHEQFVPDNADLQYACTFRLPTPVVCQNADASCDCSPDKSGNDEAVVASNSPVCQPPTGGPAGTTQYFGRAYPGSRELRFGKALGVRTAAASICPKNTSDDASQSYGYVPALNALVDRIGVTLK